MKCRLALVTLIVFGLANSTAVLRAQARTPPYLNQFPTVENIRADVRGVDAMETAAKQAGIFWLMRQLIYDLALSQRRTDRQFTPDEQRLEPEYRNAYYAAVAPFEGKVTGSDKTRWFELHTKYEMDLWLRDEVFKKYFTPELRRAVYVALKVPLPTENAPEASRLTPSAASLSAARPNTNTAGSKSQPGGAAGGRLFYDAAGNWKYQDQWGGVYDKNGYTWADGSLTTNSRIQVKADQPNIVDNGDGTKTDLRQVLGRTATLQEARQFAINQEESLQAAGYSQPNTAEAILSKVENRSSGQSEPSPGSSESGNTTKPPVSATTRPTKSNPTTPINTPANGSAKDHFDQGKNYYVAKDYAKAVEAFKKAIALEPSPERYQALALSYANLNQYPEAVAAIQEAGRLDSNDYQKPQLLGIFFIRMGQYEKSIGPLNEAIQLKPNKTDAPYVHYYLGGAYYFLERFSEAATAFQQAISLEPNNAEFLNDLGSTYVYLRRKADALQIYEKLQKIDQAKAKALKDDIGTYLQDIDAKELAGSLIFLGSYSLANNEYSGASKAFYHAIALNQPASINLPGARHGRGKAFVGLKRYDKAIAEFREATRLDPKNPEYHLDLGKAYLAAGQKVQAQQVYQKLLTLNKLRAQELLTEINKWK